MTNSEKKTEHTPGPTINMVGQDSVPLLPSLQLGFSPEVPLNRSKQRHSEHYSACQTLPLPRGPSPQLIRSRSFDSPSPTLLSIREKCSVKNLLCSSQEPSTSTSPCPSPPTGPGHQHLNISVSLSGFSPEPQHRPSTDSPPVQTRPSCNRPLYSMTVKLLDLYTSIQVR